MKYREYPKIIYPEGEKPIRVKSKEEEINILGEVVDKMPKIVPNKRTAPENTGSLKCPYCPKEYLPLHKKHFEKHVARCKENADRERDSKTYS